jgi:hypothetical protein
VRNPDFGCNGARVVNVGAGATGALLPDRFAVIIELQRNADDIIARTLGECRGDRRIHAARHRDNDAGLRGIACNLEIRSHGRWVIGIGDVWQRAAKSAGYAESAASSRNPARRKC